MLVLELTTALFKLAAGVAVFLCAVKLFSSSLEKHFSHKMQPLFARMGNNRYAALGVGAGATAVMQSSTATTVITVGLVNAGILTLFQATAVIMGANIGTTLTSLMVSLSSLQIKYVFMALCFVGMAIRLIASWESVVTKGAAQLALKQEPTACAEKIPTTSKGTIVGNLLMGFGGIFIGLELLTRSFSGSTFLQEFFMHLFASVTFPLALIGLGALFTAIIQSSSASVAIYIAMLKTGILGLPSAIFLTFGSEIGTCLTTLLASSKANVAAKRAAMVHLLFNIFSAILFTVFFWTFSHFILPIYIRIIPNPVWQLSVFQVVYNVASVAVLIWFIKPLNALVCFLVRDKGSCKNSAKPVKICLEKKSIKK